MLAFVRHDPRATVDDWGLILDFIREDDERPVREQFKERYGWHPFEGFKMLEDGVLKYPGDPALHPLSTVLFREELITLYPHAWVAIVQRDGSFEVCRMD